MSTRVNEPDAVEMLYIESPSVSLEQFRGAVAKYVSEAVNKARIDAVKMFENDITGWDFYSMLENDEDARNITELVNHCASESAEYVISELETPNQVTLKDIVKGTPEAREGVKRALEASAQDQQKTVDKANQVDEDKTNNTVDNI